MVEPLSAEGALLHAVIDNDLDEARRRIRDMFPGEVRSLRRSVHTLSDLLNEAIYIEETKTGACGRWQRRKDEPCGPVIGYLMRYGRPVGVCARCKTILAQHDIDVLDFPEVKL